MAIKGRDREFRLAKLSYIDFKPLNMDRVLTMLFPRLRFGGYGTRRPPRRNELTISDFAGEFMSDPSAFVGFDQHREVVERWNRDRSDGHGEPGQTEPGPGGAAPPARQHLQVSQREARAGLWRSGAALLDALPRTRRARTSRARRPHTLLLSWRGPPYRPLRLVGHRRCGDAGAAALRPPGYRGHARPPRSRIASHRSA